MKMARKKPWCFPDTYTHTHLNHPYSKGGGWLQAKIDSEDMSCSSFKLWNLNETHVRFGSFLAHVDKSPELTYSLQILAACRCAKEFYQWFKHMFFIRNCFCLADASQKHLFLLACLSWLSYFLVRKRGLWEGEAAMLDPWWLNSCGPKRPADWDPKGGPKMTLLLCIRPKFKWLEA